MEEVERKCPACLNQGRTTLLELCQINLTEAVYICKLKGCTYPNGYSLIFINRNLYDLYNSDSDSDISTELNDDINSVMSADINSVTTNVSQYQRDLNLIDTSVNRLPTIDSHSVKHASANIQIDLPELELSERENKVVSITELNGNNLDSSVERLVSSIAVGNLKSVGVINTTAVHNDLPIIDDNWKKDSIQVEEANDQSVQSIVLKKETIESCNSQVKFEITIKTNDLDTNENKYLFDIENMPIVLAESEEGKQILNSVNYSNLSPSITLEPAKENTLKLVKLNELLESKPMPVKPTKKKQQLMGLRNKNVNKQTNKTEALQKLSDSMNTTLARHELLLNIKNECDLNNSKTNRIKSSITKQEQMKRLPAAVVQAALSTIRNIKKKEKLPQEQADHDQQQIEQKEPNTFSNRINIIPGKNKRIGVNSSAACFEGFKFYSKIVKPAVTTTENETEDEKNVSLKQEESSIVTTEFVKCDSLPVVIGDSHVGKVEYNFEEIALNDFFDNIDAGVPMEIVNSVADEDVDGWLQSLCT